MIKTASEFAKLAICLFLVTVATTSFVPPATAAPTPQTEDMDRSELEAMILKKIEEKRKENEAKGTSNKSNTSKSVPGFNRNSTPPRNRPAPAKSNTRVRPNRSTNTKTTDNSPSGGIPRAERQTGEAEFTSPTEMRGSIKEKVDPDVMIRFNFEDYEWKDVIEDFANEAGFGVYYGQTGPPQGTWSYSTSIERNLIESLDFLNARLSVLQPPHVLIRNGNQLVLVNESEAYPEQLVAQITPEQLDDFGEYEVASCGWDLGKLQNGNKLALELREDVSQIHLDGFAYIESTNWLFIRERVRVLRRINYQIQAVINRNKEKIDSVYVVKTTDAESLLGILRPLMGIPDKQNGFEDGSLNFSIDPLGSTIYLRGTPDRVEAFVELASKIDVPPNDEGALVEQPYFQTHRPPSGSDFEVLFQILQNLLDGEPNIKMDQDANNGNIYLEAPKRIHDKVSGFLGVLNPGDSFRVIALRNLTPSEAKSTVEELLGIDTFDPPEGSPRLVADSDLDRLMVSGTPSQIVQIEKIVEEIDGTAGSSSTIRRPLRMIPMSPQRQEEVMDALNIDGILELKGRKNIINVIMPENRLKPRSGIRYERLRRDTQPDSDDGDTSSDTTSVFKPQRQYYVSMEDPRQENEETLGRVSQPPFGDSVDQDQLDGQGYQPAEEIPSVPGAPIEVRMTEQGLVIKSYDLDAADDLEDLIEEWFDPKSDYQRPTVIPLEHRDVEEAKSILNYFLGLESDSGGGGGGAAGGIGNLLGGAVKNAVGGAAGDALGSFFGGGDGLGDSSGSGEGSIELEGEDISIKTDVRFNTMIITGATGNDIDIILELVEYIDQPEPPQKPQTLGKTYEIEVRFRDPMEIKDLVLQTRPDRFRQAAAQGGNQQNARQQLEQQVARQLQAAMQGNRGGNRRGGNNASNNNSDRYQATLAVDETRRLLLVTGPEFIYEEVLELVLKLDTEQLVDRTTKTTGSLSANNLANLLRQTLGDTVEILTAEEMAEQAAGTQNANTPTPARPGAGGSTASSRTPNRSSTNASNLQREIMNRINAGRATGGRGGGTPGRGGRGGR